MYNSVRCLNYPTNLIKFLQEALLSLAPIVCPIPRPQLHINHWAPRLIHGTSYQAMCLLCLIGIYLPVVAGVTTPLTFLYLSKLSYIYSLFDILFLLLCNVLTLVYIFQASGIQLLSLWSASVPAPATPSAAPAASPAATILDASCASGDFCASSSSS